jgi:hypothetical protein
MDLKEMDCEDVTGFKRLRIVSTYVRALGKHGTDVSGSINGGEFLG